MMWKVVFPLLAAVLAVGLGNMVGGLRDMDTDNVGARDALNFAVLQHNRGSNNLYRTDVANVIKVQSQIVSGVKYVITVRMGKTNCRKDNTNEHCAIHTDPALAQPYTCVFSVWSRPWMNSLQMLKEVCNNDKPTEETGQ